MLTQPFLTCEGFVLQAVIVSWYGNQILYFSVTINQSIHFELFELLPCNAKRLYESKDHFLVNILSPQSIEERKLEQILHSYFQLWLSFFSSMYQTVLKSILLYEIQVLMWVLGKNFNISTSKRALERKIKNLVSHISRFYLCMLSSINS